MRILVALDGDRCRSRGRRKGRGSDAAAVTEAAAAADPARSQTLATFQLPTAQYYSVPFRFRWGRGEVRLINQDQRYVHVPNCLLRNFEFHSTTSRRLYAFGLLHHCQAVFNLLFLLPSHRGTPRLVFSTGLSPCTCNTLTIFALHVLCGL